jgi:hypothetical protein
MAAVFVLATRIAGQGKRTRLRKLRNTGYRRVADNQARAAVAWLAVVTLLCSTLLPFVPALHRPQSSTTQSAELERTRVALGEPAEVFFGSLCHNASDPSPAAPADKEKFPGKTNCPICQLLQHLAHGLLPSGIGGIPFREAKVRSPHFLSFAVLRQRTTGAGKPRAPPTSFETAIV